MRYIEVQIINHEIVVECQIILVSLLLHVDNHYTQKSTLDLFITWPGLLAAMTHRGIFGNGG